MSLEDEDGNWKLEMEGKGNYFDTISYPIISYPIISSRLEVSVFPSLFILISLLSTDSRSMARNSFCNFWSHDFSIEITCIP